MTSASVPRWDVIIHDEDSDACRLADGRGISRFDPGRMALTVLEFRLLYETRWGRRHGFD
jgi:hypothetical protein